MESCVLSFVYFESYNKFILEHVGIVFWSNIIGIIAFLKVGVFFLSSSRQTPMITDQSTMSTDYPYVSLPDIFKSCTTIT